MSKTKLVKWETGYGVEIPAEMVQSLGLQQNQNLKITVENNSIVITPKMNKPTNIHDLFAGWVDDGIRDAEMHLD